MKPTGVQHNDFLASRALPGVELAHNDYVNVVGGPFSGQSGAVISVEELGDDPVYLVELASGEDAMLASSLLQRAGES